MTLPWERRTPASGPDEVRARHQANRAGWNQGAARYAETLDDTVAFLRAGGSNLHPVERANLGDLRSWCRTAVHLQCASGKDTLSLWNEGVVRVVGVDISDVHIDNARRLSAALGAPAEWHRCDVLDAPHQLDGSADLVYSGRGALFAADARELALDPDVDYLEYAEASWGWGPTYIGELGVAPAELAEKHEHRIPQTFSLLARRPDA